MAFELTILRKVWDNYTDEDLELINAAQSSHLIRDKGYDQDERALISSDGNPR